MFENGFINPVDITNPPYTLNFANGIKATTEVVKQYDQCISRRKIYVFQIMNIQHARACMPQSNVLKLKL